MELQDFLNHVNRGERIEGDSEAHRFIHGAAQEALKIVARGRDPFVRPRIASARWVSPPSSNDVSLRMGSGRDRVLERCGE